MKDIPFWRIKARAETRSIANEEKAKFNPVNCTRCSKEFKPVSKHARFCKRCIKVVSNQYV